MSAQSGALEAVERVLNRGGEADEVLRQVVAILHERLPHLQKIWIAFVEGDQLVRGPEAGASPHDVISSFSIAYNGSEVARLYAPSLLLEEGDRELLERIATLVSPYALVGWDTGGEAWTP